MKQFVFYNVLILKTGYLLLTIVENQFDITIYSKVNEEGDPSSQEEVKDQEKDLKEDESDRDSGKGDTLKPNMEAEVDK